MDDKVSKKLDEIILGTRRNTIIWTPIKTPGEEHTLLGEYVRIGADGNMHQRKKAPLFLTKVNFDGSRRDAYQLKIRYGGVDDVDLNSDDYSILTQFGDHLFGYDLHQKERIAQVVKNQ